MVSSPRHIQHETRIFGTLTCEGPRVTRTSAKSSCVLCFRHSSAKPFIFICNAASALARPAKPHQSALSIPSKACDVLTANASPQKFTTSPWAKHKIPPEGRRKLRCKAPGKDLGALLQRTMAAMSDWTAELAAETLDCNDTSHLFDLICKFKQIHNNALMQLTILRACDFDLEETRIRSKTKWNISYLSGHNSLPWAMWHGWWKSKAIFFH